MAFAHPEILWGLLGLAIPVAIHFLNFRRFKRVAFSQVAFLEELQKETRARQAIRHWLVLLMRMLAVAALVCAFAQPFVPAEGDERGLNPANLVALYIDNSPSMLAVGEEGPLLQVAIEKAIRVVESHAETDRFLIQTHRFTPRDARLLTRDEALNRLTEITVAPKARMLPEVLGRVQGEMLKVEGRNRDAYVFSDLQRSTHDWSESELTFVPDTSIAYHFVPGMAEEAVNAWIDSVYFDSPTRLAGRPTALHVRIRHNARAGASDLPLELRINGARAAIGSFNLVPGLPTDTVLRFTHGEPGPKAATVSIEDAPIQFDDDFHFGFEVTDQIRVLHFSEQPSSALSRAIKKGFQIADGHEYTQRNGFALDPLARADLVVVSDWPAPSSGMAEALRNFVSLGGSCLWIPDSLETDAAGGRLRETLGFEGQSTWIRGENRVGDLEMGHPIFAGVFRKLPRALDLPRLSMSLRRQPSDREEVLATTEQGTPFLSRVGIGSGSAYLIGAAIDEDHSNFIQHALFVPILLRVAERARHTPALFTTLGDGLPVVVPGEIDRTEKLDMRGPDESLWQPEVRKVTGGLSIRPDNLMETAGLYAVGTEDSLMAWLGFNADRTESDPLAFDIPGWQAACSDAGWKDVDIIEADTEAMASVTTAIREGTPLWKAAVVTMLLALLIESLLLRSWKRKSS